MYRCPEYCCMNKNFLQTWFVIPRLLTRVKWALDGLMSLIRIVRVHLKRESWLLFQAERSSQPLMLNVRCWTSEHSNVTLVPNIWLYDTNIQSETLGMLVQHYYKCSKVHPERLTGGSTVKMSSSLSSGQFSSLHPLAYFCHFQSILL